MPDLNMAVLVRYMKFANSSGSVSLNDSFVSFINASGIYLLRILDFDNSLLTTCLIYCSCSFLNLSLRIFSPKLRNYSSISRLIVWSSGLIFCDIGRDLTLLTTGGCFWLLISTESSSCVSILLRFSYDLSLCTGRADCLSDSDNGLSLNLTICLPF